MKSDKIKPRTHTRYSELIRLLVVPVIGPTQLSKLRPLGVEKVIAKGRDAGLSERTLLHLYRCLFTAMRQAVKWQLLARNPVEAVEAPKPKTKRVAALEPEEAQSILKAVADTDLEMPTLLALGTGMRLGEVLGLRWADVDLDEGRAYIAQVLQVDGSFDTPKTHRSSRAVAIAAFVIAALRTHRVAQTERRLVCGFAWRDLDLINDRGDGRPIDPRSMSRRFRSAMDAAGLDLTFHGLRHGYATLALSAGVDLKVTQGMLGHSSFGITADLYSHVSERADAAAASKVGALLWPETGTVTPLR